MKRWSTPEPSLQQLYRQGYLLLFPCASSCNLKVWILIWKLKLLQKDICSRVDVDLCQWSVYESQQTTQETEWASAVKDHLSRGLGHLKHFCSYRLVKPSVTYVNEHSCSESPLIKFVSGWPKRLFALLQLRIADHWSNPGIEDSLMLSNSLRIFRTLILLRGNGNNLLADLAHLKWWSLGPVWLNST